MFVSEPRVCTICGNDYIAKTVWQKFCSQKCFRSDSTNTLKRYYSTQRCKAIYKRNIPFILTFEEWLKIWEDSGHLHERGKKKGQYVMARLLDKGAYAVGNVKIIKAEENNSEKVMSEENVALIKNINKGNKYNVGRKATEEARANMSKGQKNRWINK